MNNNTPSFEESIEAAWRIRRLADAGKIPLINAVESLLLIGLRQLGTGQPSFFRHAYTNRIEVECELDGRHAVVAIYEDDHGGALSTAAYFSANPHASF